MKVTVIMVADIPSGAVSAFQAYESRVLPLLARHGGVLERRFRTDDALSEVHVVSFTSEEGYQAYLLDEERQSHRGLLDGLEVVQRVLRVDDVQDVPEQHRCEEGSAEPDVPGVALAPQEHDQSDREAGAGRGDVQGADVHGTST